MKAQMVAVDQAANIGDPISGWTPVRTRFHHLVDTHAVACRPCRICQRAL